MKIRWVKIAPTVLDGFIGRVRCFEIAQEGTVYILTCELPSDDDRLYGRRITTHKTPKEAAVHAGRAFKSWWGAIHAET